MPTSTRLPSHESRAAARQFLGQSKGFGDCAPEVLDELVALSQLRHLQRGEYLSRRGDSLGSVGLVVTGSLEGSAMQLDGHRHFAGLVVPGDFYGIFNFIDRLPALHDLFAREETTLLVIADEVFQRLRDQHPSIVRACEAHLARRLRLAFERLYADPGVPLESRVASMLVMLGELYGQTVGPHIALNFKLSQTDLADWLGLSRQRVNFVLKQLEGDRLIRLHYSLLTITDPAGLKARAANEKSQRPQA